jgi:drug/metabolite transporter (DMT)-like permease
VSGRDVPAGRLMVLGAAALFSTGGAAIKGCELGSWQVAGLRAAVAFVFLLIALPGARTRWTWRTWAVGFAYAATLVLFVQSNKTTTAANAIFLQSTAPLYLLLLAPLVLGEMIRLRQLMMMAVIALGMLLLLGGGAEPQVTAPAPVLGNLLGAASGISWALTILGLRWISLRPGSGDSGATAVVAGNALAFAASAPFMFPLGSPRPIDWLLVGFLGVFQVGLAYILLTAGVRTVPALEASLLILLEPVLNPVWAWLVHGEHASAGALAGGSIILCATLANTVLAARRRRRSPVEGPSALD